MPLTGYGVDDSQYIAGFNRVTFMEAMVISGIESGIPGKLINRLIKNQNKWAELIDHSFLSDSLKDRYKELINERIERLK